MPTVLLVDDSATDRQMIGGILERNGLSVRFAENGIGALKQLSRACPDAVLTDMQMPEMDGLQLVKAIRKEYPGLPVILMTGHGSEQLAAKALRNGAASYVPKLQLNELLVDSVRHVVDLARADTSYRRLIDHTASTDFCFELSNDAELVEPLVTLVQQMVGGMGICDASGQLQVGVALEQAVLNAMFHGNLELSSDQLRADREKSADAEEMTNVEQRCNQEPFASRTVYIRALVNRDEARFVVRDEGPGFDVKDKLDVSLSDDETAGRGLVLMWALMDKVAYNKVGNEVTLVKSHRIEAVDELAQPREIGGATDHLAEKLGELVPLDGAKSIQLSKEQLSVGCDPSCDIVLPFTDVSSEHCLLYMYSGWWYVKDLKSANGTRLNRKPVDQKRIAPGAILGIGRHQFEARYSPWDLGAEGITPPIDPF